MENPAYAKRGFDSRRGSSAPPWFVMASESEAIHRGRSALDCFVAFAPRNDEREAPLSARFIAGD
jgi:hypothetical protein